MDIRVIYLIFVFFYTCWLLNRKFFFGKHFVIKITISKAICVKGSPPNAFLNDCSIIARKYRDRGYIYGIKDHSGLTLQFTKGITKSSAQRLRNVFPFGAYNSPCNPTDNNRKRSK